PSPKPTPRPDSTHRRSTRTPAAGQGTIVQSLPRGTRGHDANGMSIEAAPNPAAPKAPAKAASKAARNGASKPARKPAPKAAVHDEPVPLVPAAKPSTDTLVFRVSATALSLVGGTGRGAGWMGIVDLPREEEPLATHLLGASQPAPAH